MEFKIFTAGKNEDGRRIDRVMKQFLSDESLSSLYKSLRKGLIKVNGKKVEGSAKLSENDEIKIAALLLARKTGGKSEASLKKAMDESIVLFRNEHLLIVNKPYDVPVQPSANTRTTPLSRIVQDDFESRAESSAQFFRTGPLHRLDRKTTGILVFSQSIDGARIFSDAMKCHAMKKRYLAIVLGTMRERQSWTDTIAKDGAEKPFRTVAVKRGQSDEGKIADTTAVPLAHGLFGKRDATLVEFTIGSGRTHQIRAQSAAHGFPLLGDSAYGGGIGRTSLAREFFLHAHKLSFSDEQMRKSLSLPEKIVCAIGDDFKDALRLCKMDGIATE